MQWHSRQLNQYRLEWTRPSAWTSSLWQRGHRTEDDAGGPCIRPHDSNFAASTFSKELRVLRPAVPRAVTAAEIAYVLSNHTSAVMDALAAHSHVIRSNVAALRGARLHFRVARQRIDRRAKVCQQPVALLVF